jgi:hypothetical protein
MKRSTVLSLPLQLVFPGLIFPSDNDEEKKVLENLQLVERCYNITLSFPAVTIGMQATILRKHTHTHKHTHTQTHERERERPLTMTVICRNNK